MKKFLIGSAAMALAAVPASAQLLGGQGGLGGAIGGGLGGGLGGIGRGAPGLPDLPTSIDRSVDTSGQGTLATHGERHVNTRKGSVSASRSVDGSLTDSITSTSSTGPAANLTGNAQGSANGSANAQLIGTDAVRSTTSQAVGTTRNAAQATRYRALTTASTAKDRTLTTVGTARDTVRDKAMMTTTAAKDRATSTVGAARDKATNTTGALHNRAGSLAGNATATGQGALSGAANYTNGAANAQGSGSANGSANGNGALGMLSLAGNGNANGQGSFAVMPGMPVTDAKGHVIGTVESVSNNARGRVQQVRMKVGDKLATLPASNFSGNGNVLVSAMGKGEVKHAAKSDENR